MKNTLKRLFSFIRTKISLIIFIIFVFIFMILFTVDTYHTCESKMKTDEIISNCIIIESIKTYDELLEEDITYNESQVKNIDIYNMNPHTKSNLSIEEIDLMLVGTGLESQGRAFKDMEDTYNVNALFAMGVAMHESANGFKTANTHNYFGFRGRNGWMSFSSPYECIQYFGKLINKNYSNKTTVAAIQTKYCPDGSPWTTKVVQHMNQLKENLNA